MYNINVNQYKQGRLLLQSYLSPTAAAEPAAGDPCQVHVRLLSVCPTLQLSANKLLFPLHLLSTHQPTDEQFLTTDKPQNQDQLTLDFIMPDPEMLSQL